MQRLSIDVERVDLEILRIIAYNNQFYHNTIETVQKILQIKQNIATNIIDKKHEEMVNTYMVKGNSPCHETLYDTNFYMAL